MPELVGKKPAIVPHKKSEAHYLRLPVTQILKTQTLTIVIADYVHKLLAGKENTTLYRAKLKIQFF